MLICKRKTDGTQPRIRLRASGLSRRKRLTWSMYMTVTVTTDATRRLASRTCVRQRRVCSGKGSKMNGSSNSTPIR